MNNYDLITILGPTASGKTGLACKLAYHIDSEIISGDSRQVYKSMDIGTGKDLADYVVNGKNIPYHLIDIRKAGDKYNIFEYQQDFYRAYQSITEKGKTPILCGGSGLYLESVLKNYPLVNVPENKALREELKDKSLEELSLMLSAYKALHNKTDIDTAQRAIRAIEIAQYSEEHPTETSRTISLNSLIVGVDIDRELRRRKISNRLRARLDEGMIAEVKSIIDSGVHPDDLIYYGLEYKYVTLFLLGNLTYEEMVNQLEIAIHQFAKRQMTWFRGMEKRGLHIHWINAQLTDQEKISQIKELLQAGV
ncbi:tRNA dimethylallyltransferase [Dysgonomonas sp. PH5-45]|uniref:tRNA (adenosine(37)-N6)-dimethylallyltransferase MiaA n=1 Tax=unclassified Dysgonomonas TaxID=2630389 RepID=UPI0024755404|nr:MULTISPECIES: tRNA (adenosine(37)-N6)-dimethylallyltransferase MiaA [unclassified Dysgonomonas]MDH6354367.1 tRNA dimethylallyltransferase [Dysgonomonas sp. PH5-45]MDH6387267.1 tRNA dimethylallyltransferase [Dysgonomonas sp. PH5-37]